MRITLDRLNVAEIHCSYDKKAALRFLIVIYFNEGLLRDILSSYESAQHDYVAWTPTG